MTETVLYSPEDAIDRFVSRLEGRCTVLVACSGGGDSMALLLGLHNRASEKLDLRAATVDHGLRRNSRLEAEAVGSFCASRSIPHAILPWRGEKPNTGIQAAAREARYRLLAGHACEVGVDLVVTGHNVEDQLETLVMRRGRNPESASAMAPLVLIDGRVWVHRPLLSVRRADLRQYLDREGTAWFDDPSNQNQAFERVRVRDAPALGPESVPSAAMREQEYFFWRRVAARLDEIAHFAAGICRVDRSRLRPESEVDIFALLYAIAFIGGRVHLPGASERARLSAFLRDAHATRFSLGRTVIDKRRSQLYIVRESRGFETLEILPGEQKIWDMRFRVYNWGVMPAQVKSAGEAESGPDRHRGIPEWQDLPPRVSRLVEATQPSIICPDPAQVRLEPIIACFDRFLPVPRLPIAEVLAKRNGMAHFPKPPLDVGPGI